MAKLVAFSSVCGKVEPVSRNYRTILQGVWRCPVCLDAGVGSGYYESVKYSNIPTEMEERFYTGDPCQNS